MEEEDCPNTSSSQPTPQSPKEIDERDTPNLTETPLPSQSFDVDQTGTSNLGEVHQLSQSTPQSSMDQSGSPNTEEASLSRQSTPQMPEEMDQSDLSNLEEPLSGRSIPHSPEEMDQSGTPKLEHFSSQSSDLTLNKESLDIESKDSTIISTTEDTTSCPIEAPVSLCNEFTSDSNLNMQSEGCTTASVSQDTISCPEVSTSVNQPTDNNITTESEDCAVTLNSHAAISSPVAPLPNQEEGVPGLVTPSTPSHVGTTLSTTDNLTNISSQDSNNGHSRSGQKVKRGLKRKIPLANKGIQTSIHLLDSNSTFRDRIVDLDTLRKETGVMCIESLQDLDVSLDEWPMLLVSQLRLRDTIINNLNGVIRELVEGGQVLEQDLDYLKLKVLELQQETKRRAKEDKQSQKSPGKETESQTTEEDFAEAWSKWYYGCWGEYYSENDPTSSMYWPGHYTQQATVASKDTREEEIKQEVVEKEQGEDTGKPQEELNSESDSVKKKKKKKEKEKEKESSHTKLERRNSEKRKKLKGKRKKYKRENSNSEKISVEKQDKRTHSTDEKIKNKEKAGHKRRGTENNNKAQITDSPVTTQPTQEAITSTASTTELNGTEGKDGKVHGWDTSQSISQQVASVAAQAVVDSGYVFQEELGLYYDYNTGYYYNAENGLYYDTKSGTYFYYDHTTQSYQFHSQVSPTATNNNKKSRKRKTAKKERTKSSNKNEDTEDREEGECTESDGEDDDVEEEDEKEEEEEEDTASPVQHEEEPPGGGDIPPSLRLMVVEGGERVRVGELHVVTLNGGTVGRESTNDVHLPDLNVSKMHAEIEYRSTGAEDHHYFLRDLGSNNGTFVNSMRLSEARQPSKQVEVGHGWEVQFGPIKVKCHLHPGNLTCNECEPGLVLQALPSDKPGEAIASFKNAKSKEKARRKELKAMQKKYKLTHRDPQSSAPAAGYTDRTLLRQTEKGSDNPYEKTEVASSEIPLKKTNKGFALLQKMGWSQGQGLGKTNTGITEPVQPVSVVGQAGLGSSQVPALPTPDPWAERRRKQLQITKERYKQSSSGH
ncbi:hypothetical protein O3P69_002383 [Scylla paramamosain]|uniref:Angiogenic factor with G patch and FHA domains 1 n=1 Tax=Scylla paramamosain TaxID=85552 RepID=A0AAW0V645_SCYPA